MAMHSSVYDTDAIRTLSAAHNAAMQAVKRFAARPLDEGETAKFSKRITENLLTAFDVGERDPLALQRAAVEGIAASPDSL